MSHPKCTVTQKFNEIIAVFVEFRQPKRSTRLLCFKKSLQFAYCYKRQQDKHIITSQGLDCVPGSNFTGMWCKTTTPPKRYNYNITLQILNRVTTGMNYTIDKSVGYLGLVAHLHQPLNK